PALSTARQAQSRGKGQDENERAGDPQDSIPTSPVHESTHASLPTSHPVPCYASWAVSSAPCGSQCVGVVAPLPTCPDSAASLPTIHVITNVCGAKYSRLRPSPRGMGQCLSCPWNHNGQACRW